MNTETLLWFLVGLAGLAAGAELLVRGSSRLAVSLGISPLVVGLTIVALGTSAPELSVSIKAALVGQPDLAFGNVVGSNIFNVLVVLGLSAVVAPLVVDQKLVRLEVPLMIVAAIAMYVMALNHMVGRVEGIILVLGLVGYTVLLLVKGRDETPDIEAEYASEYSSSDAGTLTGGRKVLRAVVAGAMSAVGLVLLVVGSDWLVAGSVATARWLGVSELVIGLTLVAGGTSLPELATSVTAALQGKRDIAVGNVVGSNLMNILCVLGLTASISGGVPVRSISLYLDMPVMTLACIACLPVFLTGGRVSRAEGILLLLGFGAYMVALYLYSI